MFLHLISCKNHNVDSVGTVPLPGSKYVINYIHFTKPDRSTGVILWKSLPHSEVAVAQNGSLASINGHKVITQQLAEVNFINMTYNVIDANKDIPIFKDEVYKYGHYENLIPMIEQ